MCLWPISSVPPCISICRFVDRKRVVYVPVIFVIGHKARSCPQRNSFNPPRVCVRDDSRYHVFLELALLFPALVTRASSGSTMTKETIIGSSYLFPTTRRIRKFDRQQVYRGALDFFNGVIRPPGLLCTHI